MKKKIHGKKEGKMSFYVEQCGCRQLRRPSLCFFFLFPRAPSAPLFT